QAELPACRGDVISFFSAKGGTYVGRAQHGEKFFLTVRGRLHPIQAFNFVVRNQVNFCLQGARMFSQLTRLFVRIVYLSDYNTLECDPLLLPSSEIAAGIKERAQVILATYLNDPAAAITSSFTTSSARRFRFQPSSALAQNLQPYAQPT